MSRFCRAMRHRSCPFAFLLLAAALIVLLAASVEAVPQGTAVWTEEPWTERAERAPEAETMLSDPITFNLSGNEPRDVLIGGARHNYSNCTSGSCCPNLGNASVQLWMEKDETWIQYQQMAAGDSVELIAHTPEDGSSDLYLISYANSSIAHWSIKSLSSYYHRLRLVPQETGRLFLILSQGSSPSSALILDVLPRPPEAASVSLDVEAVRIGEAKITVRSDRIKGFDVQVNGVFFSSDESDGSRDGMASFVVGAGKTQTITVFQREGRNIVNKSEHARSFQRDRAYTLWLS
ncbi:MAG: hypothetical protein LUP01_00470 [Methanothrix sp.]|nr:hypothetical protein [Methanothrix sp.]